MEITKYNNSLRRQCISLVDLVPILTKSFKGVVQQAVPKNVLKNIRNVIITGSGDSYLAAKACIPAFKKYNNAFGNNFEAVSAIDLARLYPLEKARGESTLIIAVSASGAPARIKEGLIRAKSYGYNTLAITNNISSDVGKAAQYVFHTGTPKFPEDSPGLRSYVASLLALYSVAAYMGEVKGLSPKGALDKIYSEVLKQNQAYKHSLTDMDMKIFAIAVKWKNYKGYQMIGDNIDYATAAFIAAKITETAGIIAPTIDSENWCHVHYFASNPQNIGTVVISDITENNKSRIAETIQQATAIKRPVLFITNGEITDYKPKLANDIEILTIPSTSDEYNYLRPLMAHLPGSLLASYIAAINNENYFRGEDAPQKKSPYGNSITTSKIVLV